MTNQINHSSEVFEFMASTRGTYSSCFVFKNETDFLNWINTDYVKLTAQYGFLDLRISALDPLKIGDTCFVAGEGTDSFTILKQRKLGNNMFSFALSNGTWEEVSKCFKNWSKSNLPNSLKSQCQKLGFKHVTMQKNYILMQN